jgi:hypothetical protein
MNTYEVNFLQRKISKNSKLIREQHARKKAERDLQLITELKNRNTRLTTWRKS